MELEKIFVLGDRFGLFNGYLICADITKAKINERILYDFLKDIEADLKLLSIQENTAEEINTYLTQIIEIGDDLKKFVIIKEDIDKHLKNLADEIKSRLLIWLDRIKTDLIISFFFHNKYRFKLLKLS